MNQIVAVLMERDGFTKHEAIEELRSARRQVHDGEDPSEVLMENFMLESDYLFDLLDE
jgi:hypothetical protein